MKAPRLREKDHRITSFLIRASGNPWAIVLVALFAALFWEARGIDRLLALGGTLIGMLDIISNAYQEVSADERQAELQATLDSKATKTHELMKQTLIRLDSIEEKISNPRITIL